MPIFGIIKNNTIDNTVVADSLEEALTIGDAIQYSEETPFQRGWIRDSETSPFYDPNPPVVEQTAPTTEEANG